MSDHTLVSIVVGVALALVNLVILKWVRGRRARRMRAWAEKRGFRFVGERPDLAMLRVELFPEGNVRHAATGRVAGRAANVFQHEHDPPGRHSRRVVHHVCSVEVPPGPGLTVRREHAGHRILDAIRDKDIDFESHEFSRRFRVTSPDRRFAYDVIHPRVMDFLLQRPELMWQWRGRYLVVACKGALEPERADALLEAAAGFAALLPRHLEGPPSRAPRPTPS